MSHEAENEGVGTMMFARQAWHRLGTVVGKAFGWADAVAAGLTITLPVEKVAMSDLVLGYTCQDDEYATVRGDGVVLKTGLGEQATVFHAADAYAFGQCLREKADEQGLQSDLESLGTLRRGRQWFMTFALEPFSIGDYEVKDHLSLLGSYDGSWKFKSISDPTIVVCANTAAWAARHGVIHYEFKHTSRIHDRVEEAKRAVLRHRQNRESFKTLGEALLATPVSGPAYGRLLDELFPIGEDTSTKTTNTNEAAIEAVTQVYKGSLPGVNLVSEPGNGWALVQAVNTYENWVAPVRRTKGVSSVDVRSLRQVDALAVGGQPLTNKAIDLVKALA